MKAFHKVKIPEVSVSYEEWRLWHERVERECKFLGSGVFGQVWEMPNGRVIKIAQDRAYTEYVSYALSLQGSNKTVPRIYNARKVNASSDPDDSYAIAHHYIVVEMEKLERFEKFGHKSWDYAMTIEAYISGRNPRFHRAWKPSSKDELQVIGMLKFITQETGRLDIHNGNVMMRGNTLVFTDPLAGG